jgi:hypothetical protein
MAACAASVDPTAFGGSQRTRGGTRTLLGARANVNAKEYCVQRNVQLWDVCSLWWWLRQRGGVWLHVQEDSGLHEAAVNSHESVTRALMGARADVNAKAKVQSKMCSYGMLLIVVVAEQAWCRVSVCTGEDPAG